MTLLKYLFLAVLGTSFGLMAAGGVFTVLISIGLIPRFAGKTHSARKVFLYEEMVVLGTISGNLVSVFDRYCYLGKAAVMQLGIPYEVWRPAADTILACFGLFAGIFIGCLALAIAEMLNSIPIFARRTGFRHGLGIAVLFMALGKLAGSLVYFYFKIFLFG